MKKEPIEIYEHKEHDNLEQAKAEEPILAKFFEDMGAEFGFVFMKTDYTPNSMTVYGKGKGVDLINLICNSMEADPAVADLLAIAVKTFIENKAQEKAMKRES